MPCSLLVEQFKDSARIAAALPDCPRKYKPGSDQAFKENLTSDYTEKYRPQFHFTCNHGDMNDPNGLLYYEGEYHLFMQHSGWGHAVSKDLVHWVQLEHALSTDNVGCIWSGSAVVDWNNTSGFQTGREKPLVAVYASANQFNLVNPKECYCHAGPVDGLQQRPGPHLDEVCRQSRDRPAGPRSEDVLARADEELAAGADAMSAGPGVFRLYAT